MTLCATDPYLSFVYNKALLNAFDSFNMASKVKTEIAVMKLKESFSKLPIICDVEQLRAELAKVHDSEWREHPNRFVGNSAALLVSVGGEQNDQFAAAGKFAATPLLRRLSYIRQIMATFDTSISRSRFMRLAPREAVPTHDDVGWHWCRRIRIHVPVITNPGVRFSCGENDVHMKAGEVWVFDNFETHAVVNDSNETRTHLVIDVVPNNSFNELMARGFHPFGQNNVHETVRALNYDTSSDPSVIFENYENNLPGADELASMIGYIDKDIKKFSLRRKNESSVREQLRLFKSFAQTGLVGATSHEFRQHVSRFVRTLWPHVLNDKAIGKTDGGDMLRVLVKIDEPSKEVG